jgi:hypothetical protein
MNNFNIDELIKFHKEAANATYVGGGEYITPQRPGFNELAFEKGDLKYRDSYTGFFQSWGEEVIWHKDKVIWTCLYGGGMEQQYQGDTEIAERTFNFLKKAILAKDSEEFSPRGPKYFKEGGYEYFCEWEGDIEKFKGSERITLNGKVIFTHNFFGGVSI